MTANSKPLRSSAHAIAFSVIIPVGLAVFLLIPQGRDLFLRLTASMPYLMGFLKFAALATAGEIMAAKVSSGAFAFPKGAVLKAVVWGVIGIMITLMIPLYSGGVQAAQQSGMLPQAGGAFLAALLTSAIMNLTFGVAMMAFHRVTDYIIEQRHEKRKTRIANAISAIDWPGFWGFVVLRTIPLFWIPAHTITFLLPTEYRVFLSAVLSIVLGLLLAMAKKKSSKPADGVKH